jgi:hypothetical protein
MRLTLPCLVLVCATPLAAQVGHDPGRSPYRDIPKGKSITFMAGDIGGDGGRIGVGPHHGKSYGGRLDLRISGPIQFGLGFSQAKLDRFVVSADDSVATRKDGPVKQTLTMIEGTLQFNITGRKSWHRLAPYLSGTFGWARGSSLPTSVADSSGYKFGSKIFLAPGIGMRVILTDNFQLRLDARQLFWKLKYPLSYTQDPAAQPSPNGDLANAVLPDGKREQWEGGPEFRLGLGFAF